jgi:tRNA threonylcarbamoyladenosine modification (KEOPS) complex  Pcc1 subunit
MSLTCQVQVIISNISQTKAETVKKALEPDNVNFPKGSSLYVENIDNKLIFNFESKENMKHLVGTVDEVLEHIQVALKVIE